MVGGRRRRRKKKREDLSVGNGKYLSNWKVNDTLELRGWCVCVEIRESGAGGIPLWWPGGWQGWLATPPFAPP